MNNKNAKILLSGGGTGGSVSPLLAIAETLRLSDKKFDFLWIGTKFGPEEEMVRKEGIEFKAIHSGKLRRYFDWKNFRDIFLIKLGFFESLFILSKWRPDIILTAGSFVSVPVAVAGWILRIPVVIHQQDAIPGLANRIMSKFAKAITVTFERSLDDFSGKAIWTGNPIRKISTAGEGELDSKNYFSFDDALPIILVLGGGTGSTFINDLILKSLAELTKQFNIIHLTGKNKITPEVKNANRNFSNYKFFEFLNYGQLQKAYGLADLIISRAGLATLTELAFLGKPAIIIPIPDSHQEANAEIFKEKKAAIILEQKRLTPEELIGNIKKIFGDEKLIEELSDNIKRVLKEKANENMQKIILDLLK